MTWLALYLPELPLQLALRSLPGNPPLVVTDGPATRPLVVCVSAAAAAAGVRTGMTLASARAFSGTLMVMPRNAAAETEAVQHAGCWAYQFTPGVVTQPEGLMLEIGSALQLHGGLAALMKKLRLGIRRLGYHAAFGIAPTPMAAWLLAHAGGTGRATGNCSDLRQLPAQLHDLPLALLRWPEPLLAQLSALGINDLGACQALPRDGFIKRFGQPLRDELDRIIGLRPDPRPFFVPPDTFCGRIDFGFEVADAMALLFPLRRLLQDLEGFLRARGAGIRQWQLTLEHVRGRTTGVTLGMVRAERDAGRLLVLARERLARLTLDAPALSLRVTADQLCGFEEQSGSWLPDPARQSPGWPQLLDRLIARLGPEQVYRITAVDDHRPERGWHKTAVADTGRCAQIPRDPAPVPRPLWLLAQSRSLPLQDGKPCAQGRLTLLAGPERIESGWWDGQAVARDYYVARNPRGETFWIYREHGHAESWRLHGLFA